MKRRLMSLVMAVVLLVGCGLSVSAAPQKMEDGNLFDAEYYAQQNPDVAAVMGTDATTLYKHYQEYGNAEGRIVFADPAGDVAGAASAVLLDKKTIQLSGSFTQLPASDDGVLYVYELAVFEYAVPADRAPIASVPLAAQAAATFDYNGARLYEKFVFATKQGGVPVMVSSPQFISNPELLAPKNVSRPAGIKGQQGPTHEYAFQNYMMKGRSNNGHPVKFMSKTVALLNQGEDQNITHPLGRGGAGVYNLDPHPVDERFNYFMLNANDQAGVNAIADEVSWLAAEGTADVFIVGNEVNVRKWNYIIWNNQVSWDYYVQQYAQAFRVIYNAVKSQNAGAEVLICIDQAWDRNRSVDRFSYVDAKDFVDMFNREILSGGNIDWGVSLHPHPTPLTSANFWSAPAYFRNVVKNNSIVTIENLGVVAGYLSQPEFVKRDGGRRNIIIGEMGLVNTQGEAIQGAAIAAAYQAAKRNGITQVIYLADNHGPGLDYTMNGQAKAVYDALGTPNEESYMEWAKSVIGISDWGQILR